ncbi:MAG: FAD-binding oxidoreductase, partial [Terriglobales bacterium]
METHSLPHPSIAAVEAAWSDLRALVGEEHFRASMMEDAVDDVLPHMVIEPGNAAEVAGALKVAMGAGLKVIPRGGATKMGWGNPPRGGELVLSTRRLDRVVEHAWGDMTATAEAGCTFQQLQQTLAEHGQRLALDPLWPERATIGGILATNDSGPLRIRFGSLRDLIIGITLALPDGTLAKSGGKVVKNVAGYDLPKLATGSLGTLGIITQAIFRLHPVPRESRTLSFSISDGPTSDGGSMNT